MQLTWCSRETSAQVPCIEDPIELGKVFAISWDAATGSPGYVAYTRTEGRIDCCACSGMHYTSIQIQGRATEWGFSARHSSLPWQHSCRPP